PQEPLVCRGYTTFMVVKLPPGACQGGAEYTSTHGQQVRIETMSKRDSTSERQTSEQALWYKDALIYELHVRAFYDSNSDGIGDFPGLRSRGRSQRLAGGEAPRGLGEAVVRLERQRFCARLSRHGRHRGLSPTDTRSLPGLTREFLAGNCGCQPQ